MNENKINELIENLLAYLPLFYWIIINPKELKEQLPNNYWILLSSKYYEGQPISVLADRLSISRSHMTTIIDQLVEEDLLLKVPDKKDRRIIRIQITPKGIQVRKKYQKIFQEYTMNKLSILTSQELEQLYQSIEVIKKVGLKLVIPKKIAKIKEIKNND